LALGIFARAVALLNGRAAQVAAKARTFLPVQKAPLVITRRQAAGKRGNALLL